MILNYSPNWSAKKPFFSVFYKLAVSISLKRLKFRLIQLNLMGSRTLSRHIMNSSYAKSVCLIFADYCLNRFAPTC